MKLRIILAFLLLYAGLEFLLNYFIYDYPMERLIFRVVLSMVFMGVVFYFVFPKILARMSSSLEKTLPTLELLPNEKLILEAPANHFKGMEGVGGKLTLTDQRLVFVSHKFNFQNHREELKRTAIDSAEPHKRFEKGIIVTTRENTRQNARHTFIIDSREQWISALNQN